MRKYWHRVDEIFGKAQEAYRAEASPGSWERIRGLLDKSDAESYKEKFMVWKRASLTLILLLCTFAIYEIANVENGKKKMPFASVESALNKKPATSNQPSALNTLIGDNTDRSINTKKRSENLFANLFLNPRQAGRESTITGREIVFPSLSNPALAQINPSKIISQNKSSLERIDRSTSEKLIDPEISKPAASKWTLTVFASNDWAGYRLNSNAPNNVANNQNANSENEAELINARETHESSYSAGLFVSRQLSAKWGFKSGVVFSQTSISIVPQEIYATQTPDGSTAYKYVMSSGYIYVKPVRRRPLAVGDSIKSAAAQHKLSTLALPLMVSRYFTSGRITLIPSAGLSLNYISRARFETELKTRRRTVYVYVSRLDGMKDFYLGVLGDVDFRYAVGGHWSISVVPAFHYSLTPITKDNVVKTFPYNFSLGGALSYTF